MKPFSYLTFILTITLFIFNTSANAQKTTVKGHIFDIESQFPLSGADIITPDSSVTTISDINGFFKIKTNQPKGKLSISMVGYKRQSVHYDSLDLVFNIQLKPDNISLNEVRITSYDSHKKARETPGAIAVISGKRIRQGSGVSLQYALNSVPGVKMDQSTLSESRISIRGNGIRSPWGIRDVKIYVNDIPITEADGTTRIEALDVKDLGKAEVIKGPASSIYGGGTTGGVINFKLQRANYQEQSMEASGLVGSYGLKRLATTYRNGSEKMNSYISYGWQEMDGYRKHSSDMRHFLTGNFQFYPSDEQTITMLVSRSTQNTQIPGALSREQVDIDHRQANPSNVDKQAGRYQKWMRIGLGQKYRIDSKFSNSTSIFTYFYDLNHPLPYAYLRNYYQSYGGRTKFSYNPKFKKFNTKFTVGAEYNQAKTKGAQYENDHGKEGDVQQNIDYKNTYYTLFYQSETALTKKATLTAGFSVNGLTYDVHDYLSPEESGVKKFKAQVTPRIALSYNFGKAFSLHGSVSTGIAPPTSSEIKNLDGSINTNITAEKAINYEINAKGNLFFSRLSYDLSLFRMNMKGELIGQTAAQNTTIYSNSGKTKHEGVELALSYRIIDENNGIVFTLLQPYAAVTYSHFRFLDYKELNADNEIKSNYDGNELTGIPPWVINLGLDIETKLGLYFSGNFFYNDQLPLNDANTDYNSSYSVLNGKIGFKTKLFNHFDIDVYTGLNNITDSHYSSMTALNAASYGGNSPAYFNPSPGINGYGGLNIKYVF